MPLFGSIHSVFLMNDCIKSPIEHSFYRAGWWWPSLEYMNTLKKKSSVLEYSEKKKNFKTKISEL